MKGDTLILDFGVHYKEPISLHMPVDVRIYVTQVLTQLFEYLLNCREGISEFSKKNSADVRSC